jgi:phosphate transport system permease protein
MLAYLFLSLLLLSTGAYYLGRNRAFAVSGGQIRNLHSLPSFYGSYTALWCILPALTVFALWVSFQQGIIIDMVVAAMPPELRNLPPDRLNLMVNDLKNLIGGNFVSSNPDPAMLAAAEHYQRLRFIGNAALWVIVLTLAVSAWPMPGATSHPSCAPATGSSRWSMSF